MKISQICLMLALVVSAGCQRSNGPQTPSVSDGSRDSAVTVARSEPADLVDMRLQVRCGDRFPLIKTVEQHVSQQTGTNTASAVTWLQLSLILTIEDTLDESVVLNVRYSRIQYAHNVDGRRTEYDSATPAGRIPYDAVPFAGLVGNGYAVQIGRDHTVEKLIGHDEFLRRCMAGVSVERRPALINEVAVRFGDEGVAGFVPDTVGLLPFDEDAKPELACRVQKGDSWNYSRRLMQPVPVHLNSTCRVVRVTPKSTEIDIAGRVIPGQTYGSDKSEDNGSVQIMGGTSFGKCIVDRATGLPMDVERQELLNVQVVAPNGTRVFQEKRITTTVRLFPEERGPMVKTPPTGAGIVPVSTENPDPHVHTIPAREI